MAMNMSGRECDTVEHMCRRLINAAAQFASSQLVNVMRTIASLPIDLPPCALRALDDCVITAINCAPPDEICRVYAYTFSVFREMRTQQQTKPDLLSNSTQNIKAPGEDTIIYIRVTSWMRQCEEVLVQSAPRVVGLQAYMDLPPELRQRLRDMGCIIYSSPAVPRLSQAELRRRCSNAQKKRNELRSHNIDIDRMRASFVPYSPKPTTSGDVLKTYAELRDLRKSQIRKEKISVPTVKMTKAQEERAKYNLAKHALNQDRSGCNKMTDKNLANAKAKCQEERVIRQGVNMKTAPTKLNRMKSSSESSTSTVGLRANLKCRHINDMKGEAMSQDSLATNSRPRTAEPSTDSLSESQASNKYATYTKTKHTIKGSVESVQTSKSRLPVQSYTTNKVTKIPVLKNTSTRPNQTENKINTSMAKKNSHTGATTSMVQRQAAPPVKADRKTPKSLMNATKSSSAKVVQRIVKEPLPSKASTRRPKAKTSSEKLPEVPAMDRSGTFLKDEPTFGDKTTNFDIDN